MNFLIDSYEKLEITDEEIFDLLFEVYVQGGFVSADVAESVFNPLSVKNRGVLFAARELKTKEFAGMVVLVPPGSDMIVRAKENECEVHLLGVKAKFRGVGLGRELVSKVIETAEQNEWSKIVLWTQKPMVEAQHLYESFGFTRKGEMVKNEIVFWVYER
ncbi:GNAT family N-acetyltransferase [Thiomicrorhabdus sp. ZW0627]|uniref:GNAT family N-acetyltransferase n=1 Tax=Thiomicrorhabdus sp. ZW0627 TaxID=3039774 RepID=UPI002436E2F9|nr:GNAT family N-acetyltransferase [Thiomicrorhabdus sp. ZW0627]MDG6774096.1 GNAT family N-acetyltransferase [Thiomicrorhabdus sp. ZW0627]